MAVADVKFPEIKAWTVPLLQKAPKRLCTDDRFQFLRVELHKVGAGSQGLGHIVAWRRA